MRNIFLIGFMGTGKTTISEKLCRMTGRKLLDMDKEIEKREKRKIPEIFDTDGEEYFRNLETDFLREMQKEEDVIVSCGGGVPLRQENVEEMTKSGTIVLLSASPETIFERVRDSHDRPILEKNKSASYIEELLERRRPWYEKAADVEIVTDGKEIFNIAREILEKCSYQETSE